MIPVISRFTDPDLESAREVLSQFTQQPTPLDRLATFLAADSHYFLAASMDGGWAGWACAYELARPDGASMLFLYSIDVAPAYRRRGVGTALLSSLRRIADERRLKKLFVIAERSNEAAVAFYRATGGVLESGESLCFVYEFQATRPAGERLRRIQESVRQQNP